MSNQLKLLTKDYFNRHPVKELSAARIEYSLMLMPEVVEMMDESLPKLRAEGLDVPDTREQMEMVEQEEDTEKLLRMIRKPFPLHVQKALLKKLLKREADALPEIQRLILRTFHDGVVENCVRFMLKCEANCSEWILQHYNDVRNPYARSMLCLVLGFRADTEVIPFLIQQVDFFEKRFPDETFDQGPILALDEIRARYRKG